MQQWMLRGSLWLECCGVLVLFILFIVTFYGVVCASSYRKVFKQWPRVASINAWSIHCIHLYVRILSLELNVIQVTGNEIAAYIVVTNAGSYLVLHLPQACLAGWELWERGLNGFLWTVVFDLSKSWRLRLEVPRRKLSSLGRYRSLWLWQSLLKSPKSTEFRCWRLKRTLLLL